MYRFPKSIFCLLLITVFSPVILQAATILVPGDQPTIQAGIDAAVAGDTVLVDCGDYYEHDIVMKPGVHLLSEAGTGLCANIMGEQLGRIMSLQDAGDDTIVEGFTFWDGITEDDGWGGGLHLSNADVQVKQCVFFNNVADYSGGAVFCQNSSPSFEGCWFMTNSGGNGGGGAIRASYCDLTIEHCLFEGNEAVDGGALFLSHSSGTIEGCLFRGDGALFWGGAVGCISSSSPLIRNCTFTENGAHQGGALWAADNSHPVMENCIVSFAYEGAGLWTDHNVANPSSFTLTCCDVYGNAEGNYGGDLEDQTGINGNISEHPLFCEPDYGDYSLATDSPCLPENNDCGVLMGMADWGCEGPTGVDTLPVLERLWTQSYPNPFNPKTEIRFLLTEAAEVSLSVHDIAGRRIAVLLDGAQLPEGPHAITWRGEDQSGQSVPSGVYLYVLRAGEKTASRKITLLK